jgi:hypothetical protein
MRHVRLSLGLFLALVAIATSSLAASKSHPEFDKIKSLAGNWEGKETEGNPVHVRYKVVSGGTAVMESILEKSEAQMITVHYLDGDQLMLTHYCVANNQPRMRADASTSTPAAISGFHLSMPPIFPGRTTDTCMPIRSNGRTLTM